MMWPSELERLKPLVKKYIIRYWLLSLLKGVTILAGLNIPLRLMEGFIPSYGSVLLFSNLLGISLLGYYFYKRRPDIKAVASFLDAKLSGNERLTTYLEYREKDSRIVSLMKEEIKIYFEKSKLNIDWEMKDFKKQSAIAGVVILMLFSSVFLAPLISESFQKDKYIEEKKQDAIHEIDEVIEEIKELDNEIFDDLIEELELLKELIEKAVDQEEIEMLLKEMEELLLEKKEDLEEIQEKIDSISDIINSDDDIVKEINENPLLMEELLEKIEELQKNPLGSDMKDKLGDIMDSIQQGATDKNIEDLKELLTELESKTSPDTLKPIIGQEPNGENPNQDPSQNPGENGQNQDPNGNGGENASGGENGEEPGQQPGEGEGAGGENPGQGHSPDGGGQSTPQEFTFIPKDKEVKLDGANSDGYTLKDIMKFNPELTNTPYKDVYREYQRDAVTSINRRDIPKPLEDYIRQYFRSIAP